MERLKEDDGEFAPKHDRICPRGESFSTAASLHHQNSSYENSPLIPPNLSFTDKVVSCLQNPADLQFLCQPLEPFVLPKKAPAQKASRQQRLEYKLALRQANKVTYDRFKKSGKIPLLYPVAESIDTGLDEEAEDFITIGKVSNTSYKITIKKVHKIYNERRIGLKVKTEYILSHEKLHILIEDVKFIRSHYREIKKMAKQNS